MSTEQTFEDKLQNVKSERDKTKNDDRLNELTDQNAYLTRKIEFLQTHRTRNEDEVIRLNQRSIELQHIRDNMKLQLGNMIRSAKDWSEFRSDLMEQQNVWGGRADGFEPPGDIKI